eukprot:6547294-Alexandrium_andersonii.AAC.1
MSTPWVARRPGWCLHSGKPQRCSPSCPCQWATRRATPGPSSPVPGRRLNRSCPAPASHGQ